MIHSNISIIILRMITHICHLFISTIKLLTCSISLIYCTDILESLGIEALPYIVLLVIPILGRMSDQMQSVRLMATHCFATLVRLMPLEVRLVGFEYLSVPVHAVLRTHKCLPVSC